MELWAYIGMVLSAGLVIVIIVSILGWLSDLASKCRRLDDVAQDRDVWKNRCEVARAERDVAREKLAELEKLHPTPFRGASVAAGRLT